MKREADKFFASHVAAGKAFGELDHPDPNSPLFRNLDGRNVSHQVGARCLSRGTIHRVGQRCQVLSR